MLLHLHNHHKGSFTNYVYKTRLVGGPKMSTFFQRSYHRNCQRRWVGGQKTPKSCQRSLWTTPRWEEIPTVPICSAGPAQARPGDRETVLGFMYPIYVSAELKTKKIAVATLTYKKKIHICTNVSYICVHNTYVTCIHAEFRFFFCLYVLFYAIVIYWIGGNANTYVWIH